MPQSSTYEFQSSTERTYHVAQKIIPLLVELTDIPQSVVDLGGGGGGWLKAFQEIGSQKISLIDHPCMQSQDLLISSEYFIAVDLSKEIPEPIKCDLSISTEFAEHIDYQMSEKIVDFLTQSSDVVLFSAAIPGQGGGGLHINEQRPSFWKNLFQERGYERVDAIRPQIIFDNTIPFWFRQNLYLYVEKDYLKNSKLASLKSFLPDEFEIVHVNNLNRKIGFSDVLKELIPAFFRLIENRLHLSKK
jgi:hypothetical protein